jgi:hypothetical protein
MRNETSIRYMSSLTVPQLVITSQPVRLSEDDASTSLVNQVTSVTIELLCTFY